MAETKRDRLSPKIFRGSPPKPAVLVTDVIEEKRRARVKTLVQKLGQEGRPGAKEAKEEKPLAWHIISALIVALGVALVLAVYWVVSAIARPFSILGVRDLDSCRTDGCTEHAGLFRRLDSSLDPCVDFGSYVCSSWEPLQSYSSSAEADLALKWIAKVSNFFRGHNRSGPNAVNLAPEMFVACWFPDGEAPNKSRALLREFMTRTRLSFDSSSRDRDLHPLDVLVDLAVNWQTYLWFKLIILKDPSDQSRRILIEPRTSAHMDFSNLHLQDRRSAWKLYMNFLAPEIYSVDEEHDFDYQLDEKVLRILDKMKFEESEPLIFSLGSITSFTPAWNSSVWINALNQNVKRKYKRFAANDEVIVSDSSVLSTLTRLIDSYNQTSILNHLTRLVFETDFMITSKYVTQKIFLSEPNSVVRSLTLDLCAQSMERAFKLPIILAKMNNASLQNAVSGLLGSVVTAATRALNSTSWIDADSRRLATLKLKHMKGFLWPTGRFLNHTVVDKIYSSVSQKPEVFMYYLFKAKEVVRRESYSNQNWRLPGLPVSSGVSYRYLFNSISVGMEALMSPSYYHDGSPAINYGGLGYAFALEYVKAFSGKGVQLDPVGRFTRWWTPQYEDRYRRHEKCGKWDSIFPEVPAMEVAFRAYRESFDGEAEGLDLSEKYTGDQVFFMSMCLESCKRDGESIVSHGCNKAVSNSREFAKAFKCAKGSNMNPATKCSFFGEAGAESSDHEL